MSSSVVLPKNLSILLIVVIAVGIVASCGSTSKPPISGTEMRDVSDDLGRPVRLPAKIDRAISLAPNLTEMIFAVGAGDKLVGVTTYCNYPAEALKIEKVGDTQTPNIEKIIALKPQVVFVSTASQLEAFSRTLDDQGIAVYVTDAKSLDDVFRNMRVLGDLFRTSAEADRKVADLEGRVSIVWNPINETSKTRVFIQISNEPLFTVGRDSFLTELIEKAGGVSTTKDVPTAYPKLSKETAAALDPDVIFLSDSEDNREPSTAFRNSKAVKEARVYRINADIISRPGPRLVDALEEIAGKLAERK